MIQVSGAEAFTAAAAGQTDGYAGWATVYGGDMPEGMLAFGMPMTLGNSHAPPSPGTIPSLTKLSANFAVSAAMRSALGDIHLVCFMHGVDQLIFIIKT